MSKLLSKIGAGFLIALLASFMLTCGAELSHSTPTKPRTNGLGVVISNINPNTITIGTVLDGAIVSDKDGREGTVLRIHPIGTYGLYDESIAFCGDQTAQVATSDGHIKQGDLVFIYRRQASRLIDSVPCYDLRSVRTLLPSRPEFK